MAFPSRTTRPNHFALSSGWPAREAIEAQRLSAQASARARAAMGLEPYAQEGAEISTMAVGGAQPDGGLSFIAVLGALLAVGIVGASVYSKE